MAGSTSIEWTDCSWNPIVGCSIVSPGCTNCYAMKMAARIEKMSEALYDAGKVTPPAQYNGTTKIVNGQAVWTGEVRMAPDHVLRTPLTWKKSKRVFVNSMGDLFHESISDEWIDKAFAVMALAPQHTFQVLTKRAERMREYVGSIKPLAGKPWDRITEIAMDIGYTVRGKRGCGGPVARPLPNLWLGVSAERQQEADERIPHLLNTPAAIRFVSAEPLLGPIDFTAIEAPDKVVGERWTFNCLTDGDDYNMVDDLGRNNSGDGPHREHKIDWVIVGGESGPRARPMHPDWARKIRVDCEDSDAAFFFKQWGEWLCGTQYRGPHKERDPDPEQSRFLCMDWDGERYEPSGGAWCDDLDEHAVFRVGKKSAGRLLDGKEHNAFPSMEGVI